MSLTHTYTRTYDWLLFADPYKLCLDCGKWVDGVILVTDGPDLMLPCEHRMGYESVCPSWGPVDGCTCVETLGYLPHKPREARS